MTLATISSNAQAHSFLAKKVHPLVMPITAATAAFLTAAWLVPHLRSDAPDVTEAPAEIVAPIAAETPPVPAPTITIPRVESAPAHVQPVVVSPPHHVVKHVHRHKRKGKRLARHGHGHHYKHAAPPALTLFDFILRLLGSNDGR